MSIESTGYSPLEDLLSDSAVEREFDEITKNNTDVFQVPKLIRAYDGTIVDQNDPVMHKESVVNPQHDLHGVSIRDQYTNGSNFIFSFDDPSGKSLGVLAGENATSQARAFVEFSKTIRADGEPVTSGFEATRNEADAETTFAVSASAEGIALSGIHAKAERSIGNIATELKRTLGAAAHAGLAAINPVSSRGRHAR